MKSTLAGSSMEAVHILLKPPGSVLHHPVCSVRQGPPAGWPFIRAPRASLGSRGSPQTPQLSEDTHYSHHEEN